MDNVYSISLSKKRLPDGQVHDCTGLDSWASLPRAHPPPNAVYARNQRPFKSGVYQRWRESVCGASGEVWVIAERAKVKQISHSAPPPSRKQLKIIAQNRKISLRKKKHNLGGKKENKQASKPHTQIQWTILQHQRGLQGGQKADGGKSMPGRDSQTSATECTLLTLAANKEQIMSAKKKRHEAIKLGLIKAIEDQETWRQR